MKKTCFSVSTLLALSFFACQKKPSGGENTLAASAYFVKGNLSTSEGQQSVFEFFTDTEAFGANSAPYQVVSYTGMDLAHEFVTAEIATPRDALGVASQWFFITFFGDSLSNGAPIQSHWSRKELEDYFKVGRAIPVGDQSGHALIGLKYPFLGDHLVHTESAWSEAGQVMVEKVEQAYTGTDESIFEVSALRISLRFQCRIPMANTTLTSGEAALMFKYK
jgi:hypothetical protein